MLTKLSLSDNLPLTCSRTGTCCHGKRIWINPWELAQLANARELTPRDFRDQYTEFGGIQLSFKGPRGWKNYEACSQYIPDFGCSAHSGRPLACRLYPLGLHREGDTHTYIHHGKESPCLEGCPEVTELPSMTVGDYVNDQNAQQSIDGQDAYLSIMENLADGAFALLLESGLAESGDKKTLRLWRKIGKESPAEFHKRIGSAWIDSLMLPEITTHNPQEFADHHLRMLQEKAQELFGSLATLDAYRDASGQMMTLALYLGRGLGAKPQELSEHWVTVAKEHGAVE